MPITQKGQYSNITLDPNESLTVTKQYDGAGRQASNGSFRYSFLDENGVSASAFVDSSLSQKLAGIPAGEKIILSKGDNPKAPINATKLDGTPLSSVSVSTQSSTANTATSRDKSISWQNANNCAAQLASSMEGSFSEKLEQFKAFQDVIYSSYLEEFIPNESKSKKLIDEAEKMFDGEQDG